jgi:hypothetical protein
MRGCFKAHNRHSTELATDPAGGDTKTKAYARPRRGHHIFLFFYLLIIYFILRTADDPGTGSGIRHQRTRKRSTIATIRARSTNRRATRPIRRWRAGVQRTAAPTAVADRWCRPSTCARSPSASCGTLSPHMQQKLSSTCLMSRFVLFLHSFFYWPSLTCALPRSDPVIGQDGHTYEKKAIEEWIKKKVCAQLAVSLGGGSSCGNRSGSI